MAYDPDTSSYWCDKCGKHMTVAFMESGEDRLVLKCQGNPQGGDGCGATRSFHKVFVTTVPVDESDESFFEQLDEDDAIIDEAHDLPVSRRLNEANQEVLEVDVQDQFELGGV